MNLIRNLFFAQLVICSNSAIISRILDNSLEFDAACPVAKCESVPGLLCVRLRDFVDQDAPDEFMIVQNRCDVHRLRCYQGIEVAEVALVKCESKTVPVLDSIDAEIKRNEEKLKLEASEDMQSLPGALREKRSGSAQIQLMETLPSTQNMSSSVTQQTNHVAGRRHIIDKKKAMYESKIRNTKIELEAAEKELKEVERSLAECEGRARRGLQSAVVSDIVSANNHDEDLNDGHSNQEFTNGDDLDVVVKETDQVHNYKKGRNTSHSSGENLGQHKNALRHHHDLKALKHEWWLLTKQLKTTLKKLKWAKKQLAKCHIRKPPQPPCKPEETCKPPTPTPKPPPESSSSEEPPPKPYPPPEWTSSEETPPKPPKPKPPKPKPPPEPSSSEETPPKPPKPKPPKPKPPKPKPPPPEPSSSEETEPKPPKPKPPKPKPPKPKPPPEPSSSEETPPKPPKPTPPKPKPPPEPSSSGETPPKPPKPKPPKPKPPKPKPPPEPSSSEETPPKPPKPKPPKPKPPPEPSSSGETPPKPPKPKPPKPKPPPEPSSSEETKPKPPKPKPPKPKPPPEPLSSEEPLPKPPKPKPPKPKPPPEPSSEETTTCKPPIQTTKSKWQQKKEWWAQKKEEKRKWKEEKRKWKHEKWSHHHRHKLAHAQTESKGSDFNKAWHGCGDFRKSKENDNSRNTPDDVEDDIYKTDKPRRHDLGCDIARRLFNNGKLKILRVRYKRNTELKKRAAQRNPMQGLRQRRSDQNYIKL